MAISFKSKLRLFGPKLLKSNRLLFEGAKVFQVLSHYVWGRPHEQDFFAFSSLPKEGLFVDIGANRGQSALSFAIMQKNWRIVSFEANSTLESSLSLVRKILGPRFDYHLVGIDTQNTTLPIYVPKVNGIEHTGEGSFHLEQLDNPRLRALYGDHFDIVQRQIRTSTFDEWNITPDIVKIDVQGHEVRVLEALRKTIATNYPVLLMERNADIQKEVDSFLKEFGYDRFFFHPQTRRLDHRPCSAGGGNFFSIHQRSKIEIRDALLG